MTWHVGQFRNQEWINYERSRSEELKITVTQDDWKEKRWMEKKLLWLKIGVWQVDNGKAAWLDMYLSKSTKITTNIETTMLSGNSSTSICQSLTVQANQNSHKYWDGNAVHIFSVGKTDCIRIGGRRSIYFWLSCQTSEFWPACLQAIKIWQLLSIKENICAERPIIIRSAGCKKISNFFFVPDM